MFSLVAAESLLCPSLYAYAVLINNILKHIEVFRVIPTGFHDVDKQGMSNIQDFNSDKRGFQSWLHP